MTATSTRPQFSLVMSGLSLDGDSDMSPSDGVKRSKSELVLRGRGDTPEQLSADEREHFRNKRLRYVSVNSTLSVRILNAECFLTTLLQSFFYRYLMLNYFHIIFVLKKISLLATPARFTKRFTTYLYVCAKRSVQYLLYNLTFGMSECLNFI